MTKDFLIYRLPNSPIVMLNGKLENASLSEMSEGFIFSSDKGSEIYRFNGEPTIEFPTEFHFNTSKPYVISTKEYMLQAHSLLNGMHQLQIPKVVFSRVKKVSFDSQKLKQLFYELCENYPKAAVYLVSSKKTGTWFAASPELLLEIHGKELFTMSLAGTKKINSKDEPWGQKELFEQQYVTDFIIEKLKKNNVEFIDVIGPYDVEAGPVIHLKTDISGKITTTSIHEIISSLHPTPAVSGVPRNDAQLLIQMLEHHSRELYTGFFGYFSNNSARLYVNLRCAQVIDNEVFLYLGGGFTLESIPELEFDETENKSKTLIKYMELVSRK